MKTKILLMAAVLALAAVTRGQDNPAPATPPPATTPTAPTNTPPAAPANTAPTAPPPVAPPIEAPRLEGALPASSLSTNNIASAIEASRVNTTSNEIVPLIVIDDVPLIDAVKNLARQAGLNYIPDPKLLSLTNQPNVSMRLDNVTAQDALTAVLETYNLQVVHDPRIKVARITVKDPKAADPLFSKIIQLKYAQPTNLIDIIKKTISDRGSVLGDPRTSQLIVVATEKEFPAVDELIAKLDTPTRQVLIEAQIWETAKNPTSVKGIDWAGTFAAQNVSFGNGVMDPTKSFTETVSPGDPTVVNIPGKGPTTVTPGSSTRSVQNYAQGAGGLALSTAKGFHPATAFLNADGLRAVISFFNTDNDTEVVATPRAVTLDNQAATLSITRAFPIFKITPGSANSPAGSEIQYTNLGTILNVTPHIAANSNISLRVIPEVSDISAVDRQIVNGLENSANIYAIRRMETSVMIPSGNTLVLGGLISDRSANAMNKVPILGDAPGIGYFFRKSSKSRDKSNLIVFITPSVVNDYDYQVASTDFLQTKKKDEVEPKDSFWDSAKPYDWTKPKQDPAQTPAQ
jgi:type II secretory pathway component GspD/PulD (secretin)